MRPRDNYATIGQDIRFTGIIADVHAVRVGIRLHKLLNAFIASGNADDVRIAIRSALIASDSAKACGFRSVRHREEGGVNGTVRRDRPAVRMVNVASVERRVGLPGKLFEIGAIGVDGGKEPGIAFHVELAARLETARAGTVEGAQAVFHNISAARVWDGAHIIGSDMVVAPPAREHDLPGQRVDERTIRAVTFGCDAMQVGSIAVYNIKVAGSRRAVHAEGGPARGRKRNAPIRKPGGICIVVAREG